MARSLVSSARRFGFPRHTVVAVFCATVTGILLDPHWGKKFTPPVVVGQGVILGVAGFLLDINRHERRRTTPQVGHHSELHPVLRAAR
jgi:hypothetical protein